MVTGTGGCVRITTFVLSVVIFTEAGDSALLDVFVVRLDAFAVSFRTVVVRNRFSRGIVAAMRGAVVVLEAFVVFGLVVFAAFFVVTFAVVSFFCLVVVFFLDDFFFFVVVFVAFFDLTAFVETTFESAFIHSACSAVGKVSAICDSEPAVCTYKRCVSPVCPVQPTLHKTRNTAAKIHPFFGYITIPPIDSHKIY